MHGYHMMLLRDKFIAVWSMTHKIVYSIRTLMLHVVVIILVATSSLGAQTKDDFYVSRCPSVSAQSEVLDSLKEWIKTLADTSWRVQDVDSAVILCGFGVQDIVSELVLMDTCRKRYGLPDSLCHYKIITWRWDKNRLANHSRAVDSVTRMMERTQRYSTISIDSYLDDHVIRGTLRVFQRPIDIFSSEIHFIFILEYDRRKFSAGIMRS